MVEPGLLLWALNDGRDRPWRECQHLYLPVPFSVTFAPWRIDSVRSAIARKLKLEVRVWHSWLYTTAFWLVPPLVAVGHIFLGDWLTATLATVAHKSEEYAVED
ncbi:unnamed protein product, partial [Hapterophycus canaliculatus]